MNNPNTYWILISLAKGSTLTSFVNGRRPNIGFVEAIDFCIKLVNITKSFHEFGIVHRDIKPDNIHIDCQTGQSLDEGEITMLDFGLAYIEQNKFSDDNDFEKLLLEQFNLYGTSEGVEIGNGWYRVPQLFGQSTSGLTPKRKNEIIQQRRSSSIDASSICAIFYWLVTEKIPGTLNVHKKQPPPHSEIIKINPTIWKDIIQKALETHRMLLFSYLSHLIFFGFRTKLQRRTFEKIPYTFV